MSISAARTTAAVFIHCLLQQNEQGARRLNNPPNPSAAVAASRSRLVLLAALLYFSQGFPFGVVTEALNLYLSVERVPLATIGLLSSVGLAWTLKLFWAPLIDLFGTTRVWIIGSLLVMAASLVVIGNVPAAGQAFWIAVSLLALASATQDIAIDAATIRITPRNQLGVVNSARVTAYRVAIIAAGGGIAVVAAWLGWRGAILVSAAVPVLIAGFVAVSLPRDRGGAERHVRPVRALFDWLHRPGSLLLLAVILLFRVGDSALTPMIKPFWVARGFSATEIGNVTTTLGMVCTIAGAIAGGAFVSRFGVYRSLILLGGAQMLSNLGYAAVASLGGGRAPLYGAAVVETFCGGLGIAAFLSFLMAICDRENAATEYAMLSAVFGFSRSIAGAVSGYFAADLGFAHYFWLTTALGLPALLLVPLIRGRLNEDRRASAALID